MKPKFITPAIALLSSVLALATALPASAAPRLIGAADVRATKTTYSLFHANPQKVLLTSATIQTQLQQRLTDAGLGHITPCVITVDLNANNMVCGGGLLRMGPDFFSFNSLTNIPKIALPFTAADKDSGLDTVSMEFAVNGRSPLLGQPTESPRVVTFRFNRRIAQFGFVIDPFILTNTPDLTEGRLTDGIQFIVNGQATPVRDLTQELRGIPPFVGVEDPHGFTDVTIVPSGGLTMSYIADHFSYLPLTQF
jgi:hypothetical protein